MPGDRSVPLGGELRAAAEAFFQFDLGDVVLHCGDQARKFGAAACAWGSQIYLAEDLPVGPLGQFELLGHELAHIVQQRQGRARQTCSLAGYPANEEPELEWEAAESGWRFAHGMESQWPRRPLAAKRAPVIQRAVTVGNKMLASQADLGEVSGILDLIEGGSSWLKWAINNRSVNYHYTDKGSLLVGMQSGLHGVDLMLLRSLELQLHPFKLMELQPEDLNVVAAAANEPAPNSAMEIQTKKVLARYQLLSQSELKIGSDFLIELGVAARPVFQGVTLGDRIALFNLVDGASTEISLNPMIQKEAAEFAADHAQSPSEFVDYYQFYIASVDEIANKAKGAAARNRKAETLRESIEPLLYGSLFCPSVEGVPTPEQMNVIIQNWVAAGNDLGFSRLSLALAQVSQHANLQGATGEAASKLIEQHFEQAQLFLPQQPAKSVILTQDGLDRYYVYESSTALAQVCLSSLGNVTLETYQTKQ